VRRVAACGASRPWWCSGSVGEDVTDVELADLLAELTGA